MNTTIRYTQKRRLFQLILGSLFLVIGVFYVIEEGGSHFSSYTFPLLGLTYLVIFYCETKNKYIAFYPEEMRIFSIFTKKVKYEDIQEVYIQFGDYIIQTSKEKIVVPKNQMHKEDVSNFEDFFLKQQQKTTLHHN